MDHKTNNNKQKQTHVISRGGDFKQMCALAETQLSANQGGACVPDGPWGQRSPELKQIRGAEGLEPGHVINPAAQRKPSFTNNHTRLKLYSEHVLFSVYDYNA